MRLQVAKQLADCVVPNEYGIDTCCAAAAGGEAAGGLRGPQTSTASTRAVLRLQVAKQLADCVIPNEYGIDPRQQDPHRLQDLLRAPGQAAGRPQQHAGGVDCHRGALRCCCDCWACSAVRLSSVLHPTLPDSAWLSLCIPVLAAAPLTKQQGSAMMGESSMALVD